MTSEMWGVLIVTVFFIVGVLLVPALDRYLDNRRDRIDADRRNHVRRHR